MFTQININISASLLHQDAGQKIINNNDVRRTQSIKEHSLITALTTTEAVLDGF